MAAEWLDTVEEWRPVVGYEGYYEVSNQGRLRSVDRLIHRKDGKTMRLRGQPIAGVLQKTGTASGYIYVGLTRDGVGSKVLVHRLVMSAFGANPRNEDVRHLNGDRSDNQLSNLRAESEIDPLVRMWEKTTVDEESGCWIYGGSLHRGYGRIKVSGQTVSTHRVSYRRLVDPNLPDHLTIDHVVERGCRSRACWNPAHLDAVTTQENTLRRDSALARKLRGPRDRATHCARGHERTGSNVEKNGNCRSCANELRRERRRRARLVYTEEELS